MYTVGRKEKQSHILAIPIYLTILNLEETSRLGLLLHMA
eukprot:CAMPEP_0185270424 /NCGR_PEP_ID=MMETSP1359-20130426/42282_1 /TAXON_ID=552665 /ORGANISM="Bigelowiella longifila, Strain CCMP242" /LENGTH=38 /DNA_ID= /DNA_START= /DNA_END= /DNA_ORIENTATION=